MIFPEKEKSKEQGMTQISDEELISKIFATWDYYYNYSSEHKHKSSNFRFKNFIGFETKSIRKLYSPQCNYSDEDIQQLIAKAICRYFSHDLENLRGSLVRLTSPKLASFRQMVIQNMSILGKEATS